MSVPTAVITGGASGIGREVAGRLANGHRVALLDINADAAKEVAVALGGEIGRAHV